MDQLKDKIKDRNKYDKSAEFILSGISGGSIYEENFETIPIVFRKPYLFYRQIISENLNGKHRVLEIGAGTGRHSKDILETGAELVATDISRKTLEVLKHNNKKNDNKLITKVADMEHLPFDAKSFDAVCSAGALSYGDPVLVKNEIIRVLKPRGLFICVDSLNDNPIYRYKRYVDYFLGKRTYSTIIRMPRISLLKDYEQSFSVEELNYFGSMAWMAVVLQKIVGGTKAANFSDRADNIFRSNHLSFKFVMALKLRDKDSDLQSTL